MAYCNPIVLKGVDLACETSIGGVKRIFITEYADNLYTPTYLTQAEGDTQYIKEISELAENQTWHSYTFQKGSASLTNAATIDAANGVKFVDTNLSMVFSKQETAKRLEVSALLLGQVAVIVEDMNGNYQYLGSVSPVEASEGAGQLGQARTDANNYTISLMDTTPIYPPFLSAEAIEQLKGMIG